MKQKLKNYLIALLAWQVKRLHKRNNFKTVAVAGSVGKTTTKLVISQFLKNYFRVRTQDGNYNDPLTVPLVYFGQTNPSPLLNPLAWVWIIIKNELAIRRDYPYDVVVIELGTDGPGQMKQFKKYVTADVGVLTSIGHEHMQYFKSLDAVAKEESILAELSKEVIVSNDDIPRQYLKHLLPVTTYGQRKGSDCQVTTKNQEVTLVIGDLKLNLKPKLLGAHLHRTLAAAALVAKKLGVELNKQAASQLANVKPAPGRLQLLDGKKGTTIIDDTYNNVSSAPAKAALDVLYDWPKSKRIAVLGNMNELGDFTPDMHNEVGSYCDPSKLDLVITIGPHANVYLANHAEDRGCHVHRFDTPYQIGRHLQNYLDKDTVILFKGSQNRVFLEEAVKPLLQNSSDIKKLVRQSKKWVKHKRKHFNEKG